MAEVNVGPDNGRGAVTVFNVKTDFAAKGGGVVDDRAAIVSAIAAANAVAGGGVVFFPDKDTYLITSTITVLANVTLDLAGSTIKKKSTATTTGILVSGANATVRNGTLDGNRSGGATGLGMEWDGAGGVMADMTVRSNFAAGLWVNGGVLDAYRVNWRDNFGNGQADGVFISASGLLRAHDCDAQQNERAGYLFDTTAADNCVLDGRSYKNGTYGAYIRCNKGTLETFVSSHDGAFGLCFESFSSTNGAQASKWRCNYVECNFAGVLDSGTWPNGGAADLATGTGCEIMGGQHNQFGIVIALGNNGYGLGFARNSNNPSVGANYNIVGNVLCDGTGSTDSDPGIHFSGNSSYNYIGNAFVKNYTVAVILGEDTQPNPAPAANPLSINASNYIGSLYAVNCPYGALVINMGYRNRFDTIVSRNCCNIDTAVSSGLVSFYPDRGTAAPWATKDTSWVYDNFVGMIDHRTDSHAIASTGTPGGGVTVITTNEYHNFETGETIVIAGATNANLNATWVITVTGQKTFTVANAAGAAGGAAGTASFRKPTHIVNASANSLNNTVMQIKHRGDFQTAATADTGTTNVINNDSGRIVSAVTAWTPGAIANGAVATTTVTVNGAAIGDAADAAYDKAFAAGLYINADVSAANTVRVTIANASGGALTPTAGNVVASVYKKVN